MHRLITSITVAGLLLAFTTGRARAEDEPGDGAAIPLIIAGGGVVALGLGGIFAAMSGSAHSDAVMNPVHAEAASSADSARSLATLANTMFVLSLCFVLFGGGWAAIELSEPSRMTPPPVTARLGIGPGSLSIAGEF